MKNYVLIIAALLLLSGCEKETETETVGTSYPIMYHLYFDMLNNQGKNINDNQVEITNKLEMINGRLEAPHNFDILWLKMGVIDSLDIAETSLYGITDVNEISGYFFPVVFETGERYEWYLNDKSNDTKNWYYLIRNVENSSLVDTLRIKDVIVEDNIGHFSRNFTFFLNETPLQVHGDGKFQGENPNYVRIQVK